MADASGFPSPFSSDGAILRWTDDQGSGAEVATLVWENEAWTASVRAERHDIEYILRISPTWELRQFILFRDLEEPDLWLGTDGHGRWGEMNGAHRTDLDGAFDLLAGDSPFTHTVPVRRLPLDVGDAAQINVLTVDVETLGVVSEPVTYERTGEHSWRVHRSSDVTDFDVDVHGVPVDFPPFSRA